MSLADALASGHGIEGGLSLLAGERLAAHAAMGKEPAPDLPPGEGQVIATRRAGLDARYRRTAPGGAAGCTTEWSAGRDGDRNVLTQLHQVDYLPRSRRWGASAQYRRFQQETGTDRGAEMAGEADASLIDDSIEKLGFQVMIMAKGCPYEAATMMLKGGTGLLYLPADTYAKVRADPDIQSITPVFIGIGEKESASIRDDAGSAFAILAGVDADSFRAMKPWLTFKAGPGFDGGRWFAQDSADEIVMGFEAAEYEQRKVGDRFYVSVAPQGKTAPVRHEFRVVGVLDRTGTQDDGTVFLPIGRAQAVFGRGDVFQLIWLETLFICVAGGAAGCALAVVVTTHNLRLGYLAHRVLTLQDGRIVREERGGHDGAGAEA